MPKLLISKPKKEFIPELNRQVTVRKGETYFISDTTKDFSTSSGIITKKDLKKTGAVKTSSQKEFSLVEASFLDCYKRISRAAQMPLLKDIGAIVAFTGIDKKSLVLDTGAGSGGVALFLAHYAGHVVTYDIDKKAVDLVKKNIKFLGLKNVKVKEKDIYRGFDEKNADLITLDLPSPWNALAVADAALKIGGYLVSYSPQLTQSLDFVNAVHQRGNFLVMKTVEMLERGWELEGKKCKPNSTVQHSGFLTFCRKIQ